MARSLEAAKRIFISYSHKDTRHLERLLVHLKYFEYDRDIEAWSDLRIDAGSQWQTEIEQAIAGANVAILLLSADFLASEFIKHQELPQLLVAADSRGLTVLPVIVGHCPYEDTCLARFQSINSPAKPLRSLPTHRREVVWMELVKRVKAVMNGRAIEPALSGAAHAASTAGAIGTQVIQAQPLVPDRGSNPKTVQDAIDFLMKKGWRVNQVSRRNPYWMMQHPAKTNPIIIVGNLTDVIARKPMQHIIQMA